MESVYLNGSYLPKSEAKVSVLDRGFLFGDGVYEVIPTYGFKLLRTKEHLERLKNSLNAVSINLDYTEETWLTLFNRLLDLNGDSYAGIYLQVTRGADESRNHAYPKALKPTVFAMMVGSAAPLTKLEQIPTATAITSQDKRWKRCDIKSTSLLGNLMHYQQAQLAHAKEVILYDEQNQVTECSASNVFLVKQGVIITPLKGSAILPGVTRDLIIELAAQSPTIEVQERIVNKEELFEADEIWITSSTKEILPVTYLDGKIIAEGSKGPLWYELMQRYQAYKGRAEV